MGNVERRGLLTGPAYTNLDASIVKIIAWARSARNSCGLLQRLNIAHYANPNGTFATRTFGRITDILAQTERTIRFGEVPV